MEESVDLDSPSFTFPHKMSICKGRKRKKMNYRSLIMKMRVLRFKIRNVSKTLAVEIIPEKISKF